MMSPAGHHFRTNDGDPDRIAILLPGRGYTVHGPLLSYADHALRDAGWTTRSLIWDGEPTNAREVYAEVLHEAAHEESQARLLVIGKSLGTLALPAAAALRIPGVWLTPLLSGTHSAELQGAIGGLVAGRVPVLLAGGSADPSWDSEVARQSGARVVEIADANHSLEVPGDWDRSLDALRQVTAALAELADEVTTRR